MVAQNLGLVAIAWLHKDRHAFEQVPVGKGSGMEGLITVPLRVRVVGVEGSVLVVAYYDPHMFAKDELHLTLGRINARGRWLSAFRNPDDNGVAFEYGLSDLSVTGVADGDSLEISAAWL